MPRSTRSRCARRRVRARFSGKHRVPPVPPEFFERIVAESLKLPPRLWRLAIDSLVEHDDTQQLARIEAPTLLLWGDRDALFS
jgi:pimeloyl-ACP methyl ester carboxylesterase